MESVQRLFYETSKTDKGFYQAKLNLVLPVTYICIYAYKYISINNNVLRYC